MTAYYNEFDPYPAEWLENLIVAGLIPDGIVDKRSVLDVRPADLEGFTQCHFFAGIGGWPYALRLAGWPDDRPVWTASLPCQPFSNAGAQKAEDDDRHHWPGFSFLILERRPPIIFGEQVASKLGREWIARVRADLEALDYAVGIADLCAASAGAPHIRQRLSWVADSTGSRRLEKPAHDAGSAERIDAQGQDRRTAERGDDGAWRLAHADGGDASAKRQQRGGEHGQRPDHGSTGERLADTQRNTGGPGRTSGEPGEGVGASQAGSYVEPGRCSDAGGMGNADDAGSQGRGQRLDQCRDQRSPWAAGEFVTCLDGKARRIEPGIFPLAHGVSQRVGQLRAYGNAVVPVKEAEFVKAYLECRPQW